jgi:hypothetical protein
MKRMHKDSEVERFGSFIEGNRASLPSAAPLTCVPISIPAKPSALTFCNWRTARGTSCTQTIPMPAKLRGALAIMAAISSFMILARYSASSGGSQCDNSSGIGDNTCMSVPSSTMSDSRRSTSQDRVSILRNTLPAIITAA